ncbi:apoptosis-associated speck-like protein containing a CARD isoform 1-T1 [Discoglossus pictus]
MSKTVRDVLVRTLEDLGELGFKRFKRKLNEWEVEKGHNKIPKSRLENKDEDDVADVILDYYRDSYGIAVVCGVLDAIDQKKARDALMEELKAVSIFVPYKGNGPSQGATSSDEHFIDRHRLALIDRMSSVDPLLDELLQEKMVTPEQYDTVRTKDISQNKMRELYRYVRAWGTSDKDTFYRILKSKNALLISDLEGH